MIKGLLQTIFGLSPDPAAPSRRRLSAERSPEALFAIGDVHGHLNLLEDLEQQIFEAASSVQGEKWIVMLGDYVDRGPQSAAVLDHLQRPLPAGWRRICLCGNHEHAMALALHNRKDFVQWLEFGGVETLMSYGISRSDIQMARDKPAAHRRLVEAFIPREHIAFLEQLPILLEVPGFVFAHAGLRPGVAVQSQSDEDLLWYREQDHADFDFGAVLVHGHTPVEEPLITPHRINVDTGAYATGALTAVFLGEQHRILQARSRSAASPGLKNMK